MIEVACLVRSAVESSCVALHIAKDAGAYQEFLKHAYHSTKSISAVKAEIPIVGELWGALSQAAVHVSRGSHGPKIERDEHGIWAATIDFDFHARTADLQQDTLILTLISLAAEVVARAQELALLEDDPVRPGWRKLPGTSVIFLSGTDEAMKNRYQQFLSLGEARRGNSDAR
jgi:hypothetical protein